MYVLPIPTQTKSKICFIINSSLDFISKIRLNLDMNWKCPFTKSLHDDEMTFDIGSDIFNRGSFLPLFGQTEECRFFSKSIWTETKMNQEVEVKKRRPILTPIRTLYTYSLYLLQTRRKESTVLPLCTMRLSSML